MHLVPWCLTDTHGGDSQRGCFPMCRLVPDLQVWGHGLCVQPPSLGARGPADRGSRAQCGLEAKAGAQLAGCFHLAPLTIPGLFWWDCNLQGCSWPWVCPWGQEGSGRPSQGPSNPHRALHLDQEDRTRPAVSRPLVHILSKYSFKNLLRWKIEKFRVILFKYTQREKEYNNKLSFPGFGSCPHLADHVSPIPPHPLYLLEFSTVLISLDSMPSHPLLTMHL